MTSGAHNIKMADLVRMVDEQTSVTSDERQNSGFAVVSVVVFAGEFRSHLSSFEHKSSKSSKITADLIVIAVRMAVFHLFKHKSSKTTADLIAIVVRMAIFHLFKHENKNKTKQTPLLQIFQMPFSTVKEHFETIIMQIKEL